MPILSEDIKLLRSAVMAETPEGGGAMTGLEVLDGLSNNLFPDTSTMDRAFGRFGMRKVFGVAHTEDTDTLMGAHAVITRAPADPLVHCTLVRSPGWAAVRADAQENVERYLVKGPRYGCRIMETHYQGSLLVRMYQVAGSNFPAAGDAMVLRNPGGQEQYVRVMKVELSSGNFTVSEGGGTVQFAANIATCELSHPLDFDLLGPPVARVLNDALFAAVWTTTPSQGAAFYGIKPLAVVAAVGDLSIMLAGGIYTPVVPASTVETPLIDIAPLTPRQSLSRTARSALTLPAETLAMGPGSLLHLPTAVEPGSLTITRGATVFTDNGDGALMQGATRVGAVDYRGRSVTMAAGAPNYGSASTVIAYRPATPAGTSTHSDSLTITIANQGLSFVDAFEPPPAPGTFTVSYMAQGRWYDLRDDGNGRLAGDDSSHGSGSISYATGSIAFTVGAVPDVGGQIIYSWGTAETALWALLEDTPARLSATLPLDGRAIPGSLTLAWSRGGTSYSASMGADGHLTGAATGRTWGGRITFAPAVLPDGPVEMRFNRTPQQSQSVTDLGNGSYQLALTPVQPGSISLTVQTHEQGGLYVPGSVTLVDNGSGALISRTAGSEGVVMGAVNYLTGVLSVAEEAPMTVYEDVVHSRTRLFRSRRVWVVREPRAGHTVDLLHTSVFSVQHAEDGAFLAVTASATPQVWGLAVRVLAGLTLHTESMAFSVGDRVYTAQSGALTHSWSAASGSGSTAGSVSSNGELSFTALPGNGANSVVWINAAQNRAAQALGQGVFRVASAPIKTGVFQIQSGALVGSANDSGVISGGGWSGSVDFQRGIVRWDRMGAGTTWSGGIAAWSALNPVAPDSLTYNAVFLQNLPLAKELIGLDTVRLPLDGKAPVYRIGDLVVVHNTLSTPLPSPLARDTAYPMGRERLASVRVKNASGGVVPSSLYQVALNPGTLTVPVASNITGHPQPWTVEHRIEDMLLCSRADISGQLGFTRTLTHNFPAGTSYASSVLPFGDLFARPHNYLEQATWTGVWSDVRIGNAPTANFNEGQYPILMTNRGAITERWAFIFTSATAGNIVGESVGVISTFNTATNAAPLNPATGAPYFTLPALGWGAGWAAGQVLRFNTAACGAPFWAIRTVLQGPASLDTDLFELAFRGDVDRP